MKRLLSFVTLLALSLPLVAADAPAPATSTPPSAKSADESWKELQKLQEAPEEKPLTREEGLAQLKKWLETQKAASEAFVKDYPDDTRSWQARFYDVRATMQLRRLGVGSDDPTGDRKVFDEIANAPNAPAPLRAEAAFNSAATRTGDLDASKPETYTAFYDAVNAALEKYPDHPLAGEVKTVEMQILDQDTTPAGDAVLKKLLEGTDPRQAEAAKAIVAKRQLVAELKSKPLELKFTSLDGHEIDAANYRGKVLLLDFWASWCPPCLEEMPQMVAAYQKAHDHGFEILGVSLDDDKAAMETIIKEKDLVWPQCFEADHKITQTFGVQIIPSMWVFDKKGLLRYTGHRLEELAGGIDKLMAE
jgi:thiol-disulfide isomerase/thioredoxin